MQQITMHPIGIIHSSYTNSTDMPIQGIFNSAIEAYLELEDKYAGGLKDLQADRSQKTEDRSQKSEV